MQNYKLLASVSVFSGLYDSNQTIYHTLSFFLAEVIHANGASHFSLSGLTNDLNNSYGFDLPEAVVKAALKLLPVRKASAGFVLSGSLDSILEIFNEKYEENRQKNDSLLEELRAYVESHIGHPLSAADDAQLQQDFLNFLLSREEIKGSVGSYISGYVIEAAADPVRSQQLDAVQQGNLIYTGLRYNVAQSSLRRWNRELCIFLETDALFFATGLSGEHNQHVFNEFYTYLREMNQKLREKKMPGVRLYYFPEVEQEVDEFFDQAENLLRNHKIPDPSKVAMTLLLKDCHFPSDVKHKRAQFNRRLQEYRIFKYTEKEYYSSRNKAYNLESKELFIQYANDPDNNTHSYERLQRLNYINILRKGQNQKPFEQIGYIILTSNNSIRNMEHYEEIKEAGIRKTTSFDYIINRFWFALNRGFGEKTRWPVTIDSISKAQSLLAGQVNQCIASHFKQLQKRQGSNQLTDEELYDCLDQLHQDARLPEQITVENLEESLLIVNQSFDDFMEQRDYERRKRQEEFAENERIRTENQKLREALRLKDSLVVQSQAEAEAAASREAAAVARHDKSQQNLQDKTEELAKTRQQLQERESILHTSQKQTLFYRRCFMAMAILVVSGVIFGVLYFIWGNAMIAAIGAAITTILGGLAAISSLLDGIVWIKTLWGWIRKRLDYRSH